jgi:hypothetical protein
VSERQYHLHDGKKGAALAVRITPRASRNEISEVLNDGTVKIRLTAAPVDGKTNDLLVGFLAEVLEIAPAQIEVVAGATSKDKLISVIDLDAQTVHQRILKKLS